MLSEYVYYRILDTLSWLTSLFDDNLTDNHMVKLSSLPEYIYAYNMNSESSSKHACKILQYSKKRHSVLSQISHMVWLLNIVQEALRIDVRTTPFCR